MRNETVSHESAESIEIGPITPESGDEIIAYPRNSRLIIEAGKRARAEQALLEREYQLQDGRTPRAAQTDPREGIFQ
jgi:hypothetical protein